MRSHWPRHVLAGLTFVGVVFLVIVDLEYAAPGQLNATHRQVEALVGPNGCSSCHGSGESSAGLTCFECHAPIKSQLVGARGLHGSVLAGSDCGRCHLEHESSSLALVTPEAFALAGIPVRAEYKHADLQFELHGVHDDLACASCHINADTTLLLAGSFRFLGLTQSCADCHTSPHDEEVSQGCAECHNQAGPFDVLEDYEHDPIFLLEGAHEGVGCYECHESETAYSVESLRVAKRTESRTCSDCHDHHHTPQFLTGIASLMDAERLTTCASCHSGVEGGFTVELSEMTSEQHGATGFDLGSPHDEARCVACHDSGGTLEERYPGRLASDCAACHEDYHAGQFDSPAAQARGCIECHADTFTPHQFGEALHARTPFPLDGAHVKTACADCHEADEASRVVQFRGTQGDCAACHVDVHADVFDDLPSRVLMVDCSQCHQTESFHDVAEADFDHGRDAHFELRGAHATVGCAACHHAGDAVVHSDVEYEPTFGLIEAVFPGPKERCDTCHEDVHAGRFEHDPTKQERSDCSTCHTETAFIPVGDGGFEHGAWTGFELVGAHKKANCLTCHRPLDSTFVGVRALGRIEDNFSGPPERCDTCHVDVHGGQLSRDPNSGARTDCSNCHGVESFAILADSDFSHGAWTGFSLDGAHDEASCTACHPTAEASADGRTFVRALGKNCADCHRDPHLGQFQSGLSNGCASCHSTTTKFAELQFDHNRDSLFGLDETHVGLDCSACHQVWTAANGATAVRYKPLGQECADCHLPVSGGDR